jgi:hypothetical protein
MEKRMMNTDKNVPRVIPPTSVVRLVKADSTTPEFSNHLGERFRVGYYSQQDGLDCIWLVNGLGTYVQTVDRDTLLRYFEVETIANEQDYFGEKSCPMGPIA